MTREGSGRKPEASEREAAALTDAHLAAFEAMADKPMTDAELRQLGKLARPLTQDFVFAKCQQILKEARFVKLVFRQGDPEQLWKTHVPVPIMLIAAVVALLSTMPGTVRGRRRKPSTIEALKLAERMASHHGAAKLAAAFTGDDPRKIRTNLKGIKKYSKRRPKREGGGN
jgi:hypothetical protein